MRSQQKETNLIIKSTGCLSTNSFLHSLFWDGQCRVWPWEQSTGFLITRHFLCRSAEVSKCSIICLIVVITSDYVWTGWYVIYSMKPKEGEESVEECGGGFYRSPQTKQHTHTHTHTHTLNHLQLNYNHPIRKTHTHTHTQVDTYIQAHMFSLTFSSHTHTHFHTKDEIKKEFTRTARPVVFVGLKWVSHTHTHTHTHHNTQDK